MVREMQHGTLMSGAYVPVKGIGGHSVAQTWRDSFNGSVSASLWGTFLSGDSTVQVTSPNSFPSMYRWKGQVGSEVILFEGASGPINNSGLVPLVTLQAVYRGIDGTTPVSAGSGSPVSQVVPDTNYSVNLVTVGKGQFTFPGSITSGGIQESIVVPQVQTIRALSASGSFNYDGSTYYSAQVYYPTPTGGSATASELAYVVDRNARPIRSGSYYEGQLAGFLVSTPIYLIDETKRLVVQDTAGLPPVTGADTIQFNYQQFSVTQPLSNVAQVDLASGGIGSGLLASGVVNWYNLSSGVVRSGHTTSGFVNYCSIDVVTGVCALFSGVSGTITGIQTQLSRIYYYSPTSCPTNADAYCIDQPLCCGSGMSGGGGIPVLSGSTYSSGILTSCCSGRPIQDLLYANVTNKTFGCVCMPNTVTLVRTGPETANGIEWFGSYTTSGCDNDPGCSMSLICQSGSWRFGVASCEDSATLVSVNCYPFSIVFDCVGLAGVHCSGAYRVIITV